MALIGKQPNYGQDKEESVNERKGGGGKGREKVRESFRHCPSRAQNSSSSFWFFLYCMFSIRDNAKRNENY